jgi:hypothetical protein
MTDKVTLGNQLVYLIKPHTNGMRGFVGSKGGISNNYSIMLSMRIGTYYDPN